jgi:hypothetical protein
VFALGTPRIYRVGDMEAIQMTPEEKKMNEPMPKTMPCKECGRKPKREIIAWGFSDKDDELFLVHKCRGGFVRFPKKGSFTHLYPNGPNGQEMLVVKAWNARQGSEL